MGMERGRGRVNRRWEAGNSLIKGIEVQEIIDALDSFHAQSWVIVHFSLALKNRLEGQAAAFLLSKELENKDEESMKHAKKLVVSLLLTYLNSYITRFNVVKVEGYFFLFSYIRQPLHIVYAY
jgi:hypothetical protein